MATSRANPAFQAHAQAQQRLTPEAGAMPARHSQARAQGTPPWGSESLRTHHRATTWASASHKAAAFDTPGLDDSPPARQAIPPHCCSLRHGISLSSCQPFLPARRPCIGNVIWLFPAVRARPPVPLNPPKGSPAIFIPSQLIQPRLLASRFSYLPNQASPWGARLTCGGLFIEAICWYSNCCLFIYFISIIAFL